MTSLDHDIGVICSIMKEGQYLFLFQMLIVTALLLLATAVHAADKYTDETRPYKFGFNIQGHQHRKEEKDEKGIIMGEYGFITADGYYRVTVYATDENGDFKIISMKNYYVGFPPEDPTTTPEPSQRRNDQPARTVSTTSTTPARTSTITPASTLTTTTQKTLLSTRPTRPIVQGQIGCSNCLIPTTRSPSSTTTTESSNSVDYRNEIDIRSKPKKVAENKKHVPSIAEQINNLKTNDEQNIGVQATPKIINGIVRTPSLAEEVNNLKPNSNQGKDNSKLNFKEPENRKTPFKGSTPNLGSAKLTPPTSNKGSLDSTKYQQPGPPRDNARRAEPSRQDGPLNRIDLPINKLNQQNLKKQGPQEAPLKRTDIPLNQLNKLNLEKESDGPPPGVSEEEIKKLLYRFNYTVGFHGHHEDGYTNGDKTGDYFIVNRDGVNRKVEYVANEFGYQPNITFVNLDLGDDKVPKEKSEKDYGLKGYEFKWFYRK